MPTQHSNSAVQSDRREHRTATWRSALQKAALAVVLVLFSFSSSVATAQPPGPALPGNPLPWSGPEPDLRPLSLLEQPDKLRTVENFLQTVPERQNPFQTIDGCVQQEMTQLGVPGASIAIAMDGEMVYERGYGVKHREEGGAVNADTLFRIGSITKMMTAGAIMQQVDRGAVDLQAPVTRYVPEFEVSGPWPASHIRVWNLLTHSTGFPEQAPQFPGPQTEDALSEWAAIQSEVQLYAQPGSFWNYGNQNYSLAGLVVERASGMPYHQYMKDELWATAGMTRTTLVPADVLADGNYTYGHYSNPLTGAPIVDPNTGQQIIYAPDANDNWWFAPAGNAFSTAGQLVEWALLLMEGGDDVLSPESAAAMQAEQISLNSVPGQYYGYGIIRENLWGAEILEHGGNMPGWGAILLWEPEHHFAVSVLANASPSMGGSAVCATAVMLGLQPPEDPPDYSTDPATWDRYTGAYGVLDYELYGYFEPGGAAYEAEITREGDNLRVALTVPDPINPTVPFSRTLTQGYLDTFFLDFDLDGQLDPALALTFIEGPDTPGRTKWIRDRRLVGTQAAIPYGSESLTARVFLDYRCDGYFQDGVDTPLRDASVMLRWPNGARSIVQLTSLGLMSFGGFDNSEGLSLTVELPASYRGYTLERCPNTRGNFRLQPDDFGFGYKSVQFGATVSGEAAGP